MSYATKLFANSDSLPNHGVKVRPTPPCQGIVFAWSSACCLVGASGSDGFGVSGSDVTIWSMRPVLVFDPKNPIASIEKASLRWYSSLRPPEKVFLNGAEIDASKVGVSSKRLWRSSYLC